MYEVEHILTTQNKLGESPVWSSEEQALYWVDVENDCFFRLVIPTGRYEIFAVGVHVGALALHASGGLVMATQKGFALWGPHRQTLHFLASSEEKRPAARFNDGAVDLQGRFWAGTIHKIPEMVKKPEEQLYRLDPDLSVHLMEIGLTLSNGIGWSPDNTTMYLTDTLARTIYAYEFDPVTGTITHRRTFITIPDEEGMPDGLTVDSEGGIWSARWGGGRITRYDPAGKVEREIHLPITYPTSCTFGGEHLDELYITSAWTALNEEQRQQQPYAGDLFRIKTDIKGLNQPKFMGSHSESVQ